MHLRLMHLRLHSTFSRDCELLNWLKYFWLFSVIQQNKYWLLASISTEILCPSLCSVTIGQHYATLGHNISVLTTAPVSICKLFGDRGRCVWQLSQSHYLKWNGWSETAGLLNHHGMYTLSIIDSLCLREKMWKCSDVYHFVCTPKACCFVTVK